MVDVFPQGGNVMASLIATIKVMRAQTCVVSKQKIYYFYPFKWKFLQLIGIAFSCHSLIFQLNEHVGQKNGPVNQNLVNAFRMRGFVMTMRTVMTSRMRRFAVSITDNYLK